MSLAYVLPKKDDQRLTQAFEFHGDTNLTYLLSVSTSTQIGAISVWFRREQAGLTRPMFESRIDSSNFEALYLDTSNRISFFIYRGGVTYAERRTTATYIDQDWHHVHVGIDTTQPLAADRLRMTVDGVVEPPFDIKNDPDQGDTFGGMFRNGARVNVGADQPAQYFRGHLLAFNLMDGLNPPHTDFGQFIAGQWVGRDYKGAHGVNGIQLLWDPDEDAGRNTRRVV